MHGDADHRMQEQMPADLPCRGEGQLPFPLVHRTSGMEGDDPSPAQAIEVPSQLRRRVAQLLEVVVCRQLDAANAASHVHVSDPIVQMPHPGVAHRRCSVHPFGLGALVRLPRPGDVEHRQDETLLIAQRHPGTRLDRLRAFPFDVERHRDGPERSAGQPHRFQDVLVRLPIHEAVEGREPTVHHQLDVAELARRQRQRRHLERSAFQRLGLGLVGEERFQRYAGRGEFHGWMHSGRNGKTGTNVTGIPSSFAPPAPAAFTDPPPTRASVKSAPPVARFASLLYPRRYRVPGARRVRFDMARPRIAYACTQCGATTSQWRGQCPDCGAWNSLEEGVDEAGGGRARMPSAKPGIPVAATSVDLAPDTRVETTSAELDRVLGGGLVAGAVVLVGGEPGIGKSTLLLQVLGALARDAGRVLYVTGEESIRQVALRAQRIEAQAERVRLLAETRVETILRGARARVAPDHGDRFDSDRVHRHVAVRPGQRRPGARKRGLGSFASPRSTTSRCSWSGMSPRMERWRDRECWSTWWIRCCTSRARPTAGSGSSGRSRTVSAPRTRSACSR